MNKSMQLQVYGVSALLTECCNHYILNYLPKKIGPAAAYLKELRRIFLGGGCLTPQGTYGRADIKLLCIIDRYISVLGDSKTGFIKLFKEYKRKTVYDAIKNNSPFLQG